MKIKSVAVIGSGFIGTVHIEAIRRTGNHVKGLLAGSIESTKNGATKNRVEVGYSSIEDICNDADISVVHVTSPNALHFDQVSKLIAAGKHVICEKPLALNAAEGRALVSLAEKANLVNALCFNTRFYPMVHEGADYVRTGNLGDVKYIKGHYHQDWLTLETDWNWRLDPEEAGHLRAVADIGSHLIDQIGFVTGLKIESVMADLHTLVKTRLKPTGPVQTFTQDASSKRVPVEMSSDDAAGILLRYQGGARGTVSISQVSAGRKNSLNWEISGSKSAISFDSENPELLWIGHRGRANEQMLKDPGVNSSIAASNTFYPGGHVEGFGETFRALFEKVYSDIEKDERNNLYPTFADGVESLQITDAIAKSSKEEQWVKVERK